VSALARDVEGSKTPLRRLGATSIVGEVEGEFDLVLDAVGGATFAAAIEHVAAGGLVVNLATGSADEVVSFRAADFDRAAGARIYTFNLLDDRTRADMSADLARLVQLMGQGKLVASIGLEAPWQEISVAIEALVRRRISGKAVLHVRRAEP